MELSNIENTMKLNIRFTFKFAIFDFINKKLKLGYNFS